MMKKIYLDYAATTPVDRRVLAAMKPYFAQKFGNPMSLHSFGEEARQAIEKTRQRTAKFLGCDSSEIIFTSGATESNNLAIKGVVGSFSFKLKKPHLITTQFEHHCVLETCKSLERDKLAEVTYLPVYKKGIVKARDIEKTLRKNTVLVSVMYVNNEIGTLQPIAEIGRMLKQWNLKNKKAVLFHTDATQAVNYFDCAVSKLNVDLLSLSGHKIYGPKGVGVLYVRKNVSLKKMQDGGEQESNLRAGTHNVPAIVGLGKALDLIKRDSQEIKKLYFLRDYLIRRVLKEIPHSHLNGSWRKRSPVNVNFRFDGVEGESIVLALDHVGIAASTGSACSSKSLEPSHVLLALGLNPEQTHGSLRLSLGRKTTKKEIDYTIGELKKIIKRLKNLSGEVLKGF